jgi:hypothetical protein
MRPRHRSRRAVPNQGGTPFSACLQRQADGGRQPCQRQEQPGVIYGLRPDVAMLGVLMAWSLTRTELADCSVDAGSRPLVGIECDQLWRANICEVVDGDHFPARAFRGFARSAHPILPIRPKPLMAIRAVVVRRSLSGGRP